MAVRPATPEDIPEIRRIAESSWAEDYPEILSRETVDEGVSEWYDPAHIEAELSRSATVLLVAERGDEVVGFVHALWNREEGVIFRLYVAPDVRHRGIGTDLFAHARDELFDRGVERIKAMVLAGNEPGNAFYDHIGFELDGVSETTIGGEQYPENVYVLERDS